LVSAITPRESPSSTTDVEVLARLGPDRLVGGDDEQDEVDAARAREHVSY
jgi:hypothetical protein